MTNNCLSLAVAALVLSGCVIVPPPTVSAFNGDSVTVQTVTALAPFPSGATHAEATRVCGMAGRRAEYASSRLSDKTYSDHLYLCL